MSRLPAQVRNTDAFAYIECDNATGKYFKINPLTDDKYEVCGQICKDGSRCDCPIEDKTCEHRNNVQVSSSSDKNLFDTLKIIANNGNNVEIKSELEYCLQLAQDLSHEQITNLDNDIRLAYGVVHLFIKQKTTPDEAGNTPRLTQKDMQFIMSSIQNIVKAKETHSRMQNISKLDSSVVQEFILEIFSVLKSEVDSVVFKKIQQRIFDEIIMPRRNASVLTNKVEIVDATTE